jgi:hypothetical protein
MPTYQVISIIDSEPTFEKPLNEIVADLKEGGALQTLTPLEHHTARQRRWYKGICLRDLVKHDENGETTEWWDTEVKRLCGGLAYLKREGVVVELRLGDEIQRITIGRLTTKGVGKKNMTAFIEEILSKAIEKGWPVSPPDPELRSDGTANT